MTQHTDTIIIGGGLSGLSVAHTLRTRSYGHRFVVLEKSARTGGVIGTHRQDGFTAEIGPHGFLDNCPESAAILKDCGLEAECLKSPLIDFVRYVLLGGELRMIPQSPLKIAAAPLIPWSAKFRVLADLWKKPLEGEPTVAKWVHHRFGPALLPFADAVYTGTYAGDFNRLTIDSVMPGVRELEKRHGSVIRGLVAKAREKKKKKRTANSASFTMPAMTSFPQGMTRLPEKLTEYLKPERDLFLHCEVFDITREGKSWRVDTGKGRFQAANIVLAIPTNNAIQLLEKFVPPPMPSIPEATIINVVFGFGPDSSLPPGFGYLVPEQEQRFCLGSLFSSNMFPFRAPSGHILFETLIGGRRHPEKLELSDDELLRRALADVREVLPLKGDPVFTKVLRPWGPIPQLERGYPALLHWRDRLVENLPGLFLCGFGWEGIGINDMIKHGVRTAEAVQAGAEAGEKEKQLKGVYF